jgi:hypothetical protein
MRKVNYLESLAEIPLEGCLKTSGSRPLRVMCGDMNHYICKYFTGAGPATSLFNEYITCCFLEEWGLPVPKMAVVKISPDHIKQTGMPSHYFQRPCFGSLYHGNYVDVDQFLAYAHRSKQIMEHLSRSILSIAMFDLWIANEDRTGNNYNLLFNPTTTEFVPIDHVMAFNGNNLDKEPCPLTLEDSILNSILVQRLFFRTLQPERNELRLKTIITFENDVAQCHRHLSTFLQHVPEAWNISLVAVNERLRFLFSKDWTSQCSGLFSQYLQISLMHR